MRSITESASLQFAIAQRGHGLETMAGGPHSSLDAILAEIEKNIPGASAGAIPAVSLRRRLIAFQWRCGGGGGARRTVSRRASPVVLHAALVAYFKLLRMGGAGLRYAGIGRLDPWHHRPAAFFDICRLFI
jgi:hypothetical protein